ncbi:MAG TPA: S1 RNA-binding domain-containing protein, partial [Solirubrobacterales bacterium]|nr:S1 RNA-binding domain-containing protein [Solirubrobacterales bacterium]
DRDRQRISLGLKQTQEDPWQRVISAHRPGDVLGGTVTKVVAFGAFVEILPGVEGLVHISELADHHVESPSEVVEPGATLDVKILEIDEERRRLSLSIKQVEEQRMPMGDLGAQIQEAASEGSAESSDESATGPVAAEDSSSSQAAGEEPTATPPVEDTAEVEVVEEPAGEEAPAEEAPAPEAEEVPAAEEAPEVEAEVPVAEEALAEDAAAEAEEPAAEADAPAEESSES